jgi:CheY-like chemotaxis protein
MSNYVLVVDDNSSDLKLAKLLIESEGFVAILATDAFAALEKINEYEFKLIVVDIQMPNVSGLELLKRIKKIDA